jgi:hypothetical protein
MSRIQLVMMRKGFTLVPYGEVAESEFDKIPSKEPVIVAIHQPRHPEHHAKLWAILTKVAQFDPTFGTAEAVLVWLKLKMPNMHHVYRFRGEQLVIVPKSISFASMDQITFRQFYDEAMQLLAERLGCDPEELLDDRTRVA